CPRRRRQRARRSSSVPQFRDLRATHTSFIPNCSPIPPCTADADAVASFKHLRRLSSVLRMKELSSRALFLLALTLSLAAGALVFRGASPGQSQARSGHAPFSNVILDDRSAGVHGKDGGRGAHGARGTAGKN